MNTKYNIRCAIITNDRMFTIENSNCNLDFEEMFLFFIGIHGNQFALESMHWFRNVFKYFSNKEF